ncbi:uncharacterized protein [Miscanthus floridulus]|uniref:uncharacterized protein isoform X6 n=1 Tax=Miscanthus floridulus TaxID=154761 RepID=UPI0034577BB5
MIRYESIQINIIALSYRWIPYFLSHNIYAKSDPLIRFAQATFPNHDPKMKSNMEALRTEPVAEGETAVSSVQVVSQVLSQNSSNLFLKSVGIKLVPSSKSSSSNESELREQLAAEATAAVQGEIDELRKRSEEAEEKLARTQKEMDEYKKLTEISNKAMEENNALLKRILAINNASST